ncbi:T4 RnlA family RNA ligase [Taibaiella koreensis]|uniref:T4 RnlA family RNA ligase n=1 Tax=Taibaiella koreensis TaxID=1268548 RepID=UPI0013C350C0|nr:T4 RnlA family RNA ligase [Taibaiella koreensis]
MATINNGLLQQAMEKGWIVSRKHPQDDLYIYNYTAQVQYERAWNEITLACRGLILDAAGNVVARPFPKFFNLGEQSDAVLPAGGFEVFEKMDGSLGILYWSKGEPYIATRGSFTSDQAQKANALLYDRYREAIPLLNPERTYLFEIIYPANRIVVDYGDQEALVLLAVIDTESGAEFPPEEIGFPVVKRYNGVKDLSLLKQLEDPGKEGFVIRFDNNYRLKVKFAEYQRLHWIITQISSIDIWEYLRDNRSFDELLEKVPDEFYQWVKQTRERLLLQYAGIEQQCRAEFKVLDTRKETALYFNTCSYPGLLFSMLNGQDYAGKIWRMLRPAFEKPFAIAEE